MQLPDNHDDQQNEGLQAPPGLVSALKRLPRQPIFVPPTADEAILRAAERHLLHPNKPGFRRFFIMPWATTAAALLLLAVTPHLLRKPTPPPNDSSRFVHDGRVDILDAFALARQLKAGSMLNPQLDINGDGVVDERDVATLAARAVRLEKGGRS